MTLGSPSRSPGLARGPLGRLREVSQGPGEAREGRPTGACHPVDWAWTRVNLELVAESQVVEETSEETTTTTSEWRRDGMRARRTDG